MLVALVSDMYWDQRQAPADPDRWCHGSESQSGYVHRSCIFLAVWGAARIQCLKSAFTCSHCCRLAPPFTFPSTDMQIASPAISTTSHRTRRLTTGREKERPACTDRVESRVSFLLFRVSCRRGQDSLSPHPQHPFSATLAQQDLRW